MASAECECGNSPKNRRVICFELMTGSVVQVDSLREESGVLKETSDTIALETANPPNAFPL